MEKKITPALKFEDFLYESKVNAPKNAKLIKLFEAQEVNDTNVDDKEGIDLTQENQAQKQPINDEDAYNDESLCQCMTP